MISICKYQLKDDIDLHRSALSFFGILFFFNETIAHMISFKEVLVLKKSNYRVTFAKKCAYRFSILAGDIHLYF
jgi:hypothetical protein